MICHNYLRNLLIFAIILISFSCNKKDDELVVDFEAAESEAQMEMVLEDVDYITFEGMELSNNIYAKYQHDEGPLGVACVKVSFNLENNTTTLDFGGGCEGPDGKIRKGKMVISQTGKYFTPGSIITAQLDQYSVNDVKIEGIRRIENMSTDNTTNPIFSLRLENGRFNWSDGTHATRETSQSRTWTLTENRDQLTFSIDGSANGITRRGENYSSETTQMLTYDRSCTSYLPTTGIQTLILENSNEQFEIDYGTGACENKVVLKKTGSSMEFSL